MSGINSQLLLFSDVSCLRNVSNTTILLISGVLLRRIFYNPIWYPQEVVSCSLMAFHKGNSVRCKHPKRWINGSAKDLTHSLGSFLTLATSRMELIVLWNHVFLEAWISFSAEFSWCVKSCVLHSDSTRASFVWANSSSNSRT